MAKGEYFVLISSYSNSEVDTTKLQKFPALDASGNRYQSLVLSHFLRTRFSSELITHRCTTSH